MSKNYSIPILDGEGANDYARFMRTDALLSLQRRPEQMAHRDELLFQIVHQSAELWLKLCRNEAADAADAIRAGAFGEATEFLARAALAVRMVTDQLEMMIHLNPWTFQTIRAVLGHGSGFESPGWAGVHSVGKELNEAFCAVVADRNVDLAELYRDHAETDLYRLAEALLEWDERIALWRVRHYKVATRIIGHDVVGTKGTPVETLTRLIGHEHFPALWRVRTELTCTGPMAADQT